MQEETVTLTAPTVERLTLNVTHEIHVRASVDATFDALLEQMGPGNETPDGKPLPMTIEARPGGRWFRDLGNDDGHFWGHVQAIKRPTLLEITGPLFMSQPVVSNVQYRLKEIEGGTLIAFRHTAFGFVPDEYREGVGRGWTSLLDHVRNRAEASRTNR
jgi:Activator of Hsp90 ATPase homolog 1-like protein